MSAKKRKGRGLKFAPRPYKPKKTKASPKHKARPYKPRKPKAKKPRSHDEILAAARNDLKRISKRKRFTNLPKTLSNVNPNRLSLTTLSEKYMSKDRINIGNFVRYTRPDIELNPSIRTSTPILNLSDFDGKRYSESIFSQYSAFDSRVRLGHFYETEVTAFSYFAKTNPLTLDHLEINNSRSAKEAIWEAFENWKSLLPSLSADIASEIKSKPLPQADAEFFQKKDFSSLSSFHFMTPKVHLSRLIEATQKMERAIQEIRRSALSRGFSHEDRNNFESHSDSLLRVIVLIRNETQRLINLAKCRIGIAAFG